jgi:hypothetical protein
MVVATVGFSKDTAMEKFTGWSQIMTDVRKVALLKGI